MTAKRLGIALISALLTIAPLSNGVAGWDPRKESKPAASGGHSGNRAVDQSIAKLKAKDSSLKTFFKHAYGYAIFPTVGKAGIGLGGAYGEGEVYRQGSYIGNTTLSQISFGFQLGGQSYIEIIFFKDKHALNDFTNGNFQLSAEASAVAITAGVSADTDYSDGVAIFTMPKQGLMYEAAVAGQKFSFTPAK